MNIEDLIASPVKGINAFNELAIDAAIWREAHDHHHVHRRLHALSSHRPGVVYGLEVVVYDDKDGKTLLVAPGIAVDDNGQVVVLSRPTKVAVAERGLNYIILQYEAQLDSKSEILVASGKDYFRLLEGRSLIATKELPDAGISPFVELGRVFRTGADKSIREAKNPFDPASDELNLLHRMVAFPHCYADMAVAELGYLPSSDGDPNAWKPNRAGLVNLIRAGNGSGFHLSLLPPFAVAEETRSGQNIPALLYMSGKGGFKALSDGELKGLTNFLTAGGSLLGEACGGSKDFEKSFKELASKVGAGLKPVEAGHPLLTAHHLFPAVPAGSNTGGAVTCDEATGVIFSSMDYGAAWQGQLADVKDAATQGRERVRQSQEFGLNLLSWAAKRRRTQELRRLK